MRRLECGMEKKGSVVVVRPMGRLDSGQGDRFEKILADEVRKGNHRLVLDMSELTFIASSALRIMLVTARAIKSREGVFVVAAPLPHILDVLRTAGFDRLLKVMDTAEAAIESARDPEEDTSARVAPRAEPEVEEDHEREAARRRARAAAEARQARADADEAEEEAGNTAPPKPRRKRRRSRLMRALAAMWKALTGPEPDDA